MDADERRNLEYWYATHKRAARAFIKSGNLTSARRQLAEVDRVRGLLEAPNPEAPAEQSGRPSRGRSET